MADRRVTEVSDIDPDASNILSLTASETADGSAVCTDLHAHVDPSRLHALSVTFPENRSDGLGDGSSAADDRPRWTTTVLAGSFSRSASASGAPSPERNHVVETVEDPSDVSELGIEISRALERLEGTAAGPAHTRLCFDSVTALLRHVDEQRAFKFLHLLTKRVERAGAVGHYHLDGDACDEQMVATLSPLFDVVVGPDPEPDA